MPESRGARVLCVFALQFQVEVQSFCTVLFWLLIRGRGLSVDDSVLCRYAGSVRIS